jgi:hypothetical protein
MPPSFTSAQLRLVQLWAKHGTAEVVKTATSDCLALSPDSVALASEVVKLSETCQSLCDKLAASRDDERETATALFLLRQAIGEAAEANRIPSDVLAKLQSL